MRTIFLNRFFFPDHSATSQMLSDLAFDLARRGKRVTVITSRQRYDIPGARLPRHEIIKGVEIIRLTTPAFGRGSLPGRFADYLGFYLAATATLIRTVSSDCIVIAKTDPPLISIPAAIVCRVRGARLINWLQDLFPEVAIALGVGGLKGVFGRVLRYWRNWSLRVADMNVAIGERMRDQLIEEGLSPDRITVIHNWADGESIVPIPPEENPLRRAWQLDNKFVVGYSGNLGRAHEFETLLEAADRLRSHTDIVFLFIGAGAQAKMLQEATVIRDLPNFVFKPYQPRTRLHYSLGVADLHLAILRPELEGLIVPSKYYGIAASGRPLIFIGATDGELANLITSSESGVSISLGDTEQLALSILTIKTEKTATLLGNNARTYFERHFTLPRAMGMWSSIIDKNLPVSGSVVPLP